MMQVVAGVLRCRERVLTAWRKREQHAGGCWEFPGGKVLAGEAREDALRRELYEEIGIQASLGLPVICLRHRYADREIMLDVHEASAPWQDICAMEKQFLRWYPVKKLQFDDFPIANRAVINALRLPHAYAITPPLTESEALIQSVKNILSVRSADVRLIVLRAPQLADYISVVEYLLPIVQAANVRLMVHDRLDVLAKFGNKIAGIHLSQAALHKVKQRPVALQQWFAASCHNLTEIQLAIAKGADFCVLGPVQDTVSHPEQPSLGMAAFTEMVAQADIPVFALGGMQLDDRDMVRRHGGQGIAGIRCLQNA